jgi:hypothetical protein
MKRIRPLKLIVIALAVLFVSPVVVCLGSHLVALNILWQHATPLFDYPLPPQTIILERHAEYVDSDGNSDCVGYVWMVVATPLTARELNDYYHTDAAYEQISLPLVGASIDGQLPDGSSRAVIDSYGGIDGRSYSLLCGW